MPSLCAGGHKGRGGPGPDPTDSPSSLAADAQLRMLEDRMCRPGFLISPLRYWLSPPARDLDPLEIGPNQSVADLGASAGFHSIEILRRIVGGGTLFLVDIDRENLDIARHRLGEDPRVRSIVGSASEVSEIPTDSVDRVLLSLVLCCLVDKDGVMDETWRILRPGGRVLITYPKFRILRSGRRASYAVSKELWATLVRRRPWTALPVPAAWFVARHMLEKPRA